LYQQVRYCEKNNIGGSFVECGVWKGGAVGLMALANLREGKTRRDLHLFDAFQDICEPDAKIDGVKASNEVKEYTGKSGHDTGLLKPVTGFYDFLGGAGSIEENKTLLEHTIGYPSEHTHYHKGWFQETLPSKHEEVGSIAILRLDGDWYASTKVCLEYLYDKVVPGGFIIIDDYGAYEGCRKAVDEFMELNKITTFLSTVDNNVRYFIKPCSPLA